MLITSRAVTNSVLYCFFSLTSRLSSSFCISRSSPKASFNVFSSLTIATFSHINFLILFLNSCGLIVPFLIIPSILEASFSTISSLVFKSVCLAALDALSPAIFPNTCVSASALPPKRFAP